MKILNQLTNKHLLLNKRRTIVTIIGVMLSTALMCGIGLLISTFRDYAIRDEIQNTGDYFARISHFPLSEMERIQKDNRISSYYTLSLLGYSPIYEEHTAYETTYTYAIVRNADATYLRGYSLKEGRYPKSANEIIATEKTALYLQAKVGDKITLSLGELDNYKGDYYLPYDASYQEKEKRTFRLVGLIATGEIRDEEWYRQGYLFTSYSNHTYDTTLYLKTKKPKEIYKVVDEYYQKLDQKYPLSSIEVNYHTSLLAMYGVSQYQNIMSSITKVMALVLALLSIGCTIVIYNSFAISVMERKKQFGLFSSIGATKKQLRYTVFYEAFVVGTIGITLGVLASFVGIGIVVSIMNHLLQDVFTQSLYVTVYPMFLILPLFFMMLVVFFSAYSPSRKASRVSPIEAIRGNDEIKINKKKIKVGILTRKIFGIEGEIALKNIKRNKKKYRITIISLVTSIVLFNSFSTLLDKIVNIDDVIFESNHDIAISYQENKEASSHSKKDAIEQLETILTSSEVKEYLVVKNQNMYFSSDLLKFQISPELKAVRGEEPVDLEESEFDRLSKQYQQIYMVALDDKSYQKLLQKYHLKEEVPFFLNHFETISYQNQDRSLKKGRILKKKMNSISLCDMSSVIEGEDYTHYHLEGITCPYQLQNIYFIDEIPLGFKSGSDSSFTFFVSEKMYAEIEKQLYPHLQGQMIGISHIQKNDAYHYSVYLKVKGYQKLNEMFTEIQNHDVANEYSYENIKEEIKNAMNLVFIVKLLFYGFIALVTLIGVTSVFNTLNTSIQLRKKEFAMLRSMGLSPKGFRRMILFESVFFGAKSLLIGLPISFAIIYMMNMLMDSISSSFSFPLLSFGISIVAVFLIVLLTMGYATSKIKHDNILDTIREENI